MKNLIKSGSCSIVFGENYFKKFIEPKKNKLLKVTHISGKHNELSNCSLIRKIENYSKYYTIPDEELFHFNSSDKFYLHIKELLDYETMQILKNEINCYFIDYAGDKDVYETIIELSHNNFKIWDSYKRIIKFSKKILEGLTFLHMNKICHLDIKPENIIYNSKTKDFRIIDFGFSSVEPFNDFIIDFRGTPGYFPKYYENEKPTKYLPKVRANDMLFKNGNLPLILNRKLVYKIDSYCLGRLLYCLKNIYKDNKVYGCYNNEKRKECKLDHIINCLIENDVHKRYTIIKCYNKHF